MVTQKSMFFSKIDHFCRTLLHKLKYKIPHDSPEPSRIKVALSLILPSGAMVFSFGMLKVALLVCLSSIVGLAYKFSVNLWRYQAYKYKYEHESHQSQSLPVTPFLVYAGVLGGAIIVLVICFILAIIKVSYANTACIISAITNIIATWFMEIIDALIVIYEAQVAVPHCFLIKT